VLLWNNVSSQQRKFKKVLTYCSIMHDVSPRGWWLMADHERLSERYKLNPLASPHEKNLV
jgi:hypothetical protein